MIELILREFYRRADPSRAGFDFLQSHGLNADKVLAHAGNLAIISCRWTAPGFFQFDDGGEPFVVIECLDESEEHTIDLAGWPVGNPDIFGTYLGQADALGISAVYNPATWSFGHMLQMRRRPIDWLRADCDGCCILDHRHVTCWLRYACGPIAAEDVEHGRAIEEMLRPKGGPKIVVPKSSIARRAA